MSQREVQLTGGPPWGFRMTGGSDSSHHLKISRVNPGSNAAEKIREGDLISSINGKDATNLTNQEAHALFKAASDTLDLVLHNKRCEEQKRKKNKAKRKEGIESPNRTTENKADLSKVSINSQKTILPLSPSPEYIWLRKSREKKRSGSLSSLPDTRSMSQSISSDEESMSSATDSASRVDRQNAWLRSVKQGRSTRTKMRIIKALWEQEYNSEPETGDDNLTLDDQHEQYMNDKRVQKNSKKSPRLRRKHKNRGKCRALGSIDNYIPEKQIIFKAQMVNSKTSDEPKKKKYVHQILSEGYDSDQELTVKKTSGNASIDEDGIKTVYKLIQSGGDIPRSGLGSKNVEKVEYKSEYTEDKINIHYKAPIRSENKVYIPEDILDEEFEEKMIQVYRDMEIKKQSKLEEDYEKRKHHDNFLPKEKNNIASIQYDKTDGAQTNKKSIFGLKAKALYDFVAENPKELSFQKGNILTITADVDEHWLRGEINERKGILPSNYVQFIANTKEEKLKVKAKFNFKAKSSAELTMLKGEILLVERKIDANWVEVSLGERMGLVPIDYLRLLEDTSGENSLASTPATPERPQYPGVCVERLFKPSDLLKSKLREDFSLREKNMQSVDKFLREEMSEILEKDESYQVSTQENPNDPHESNSVLGHYFLFKAVSDYQPSIEAELALSVGDLICVLEDFHDGWMAGVEEESGRLGLFPARCVERL